MTNPQAAANTPTGTSKDAPATAAGRRFLAEGEDCWFDWTGMAGDVVDAVLAIEAEAFMEGARASRENRVAIEAEASGSAGADRPEGAAAPTPAERREALRELSRDADDLGIYVEPPISGSLREALERLFRFHPAPWRSPATLQPWPNEAAYLDRIVDASGNPVFGPGNWKDACERNMALVHLVNALAATPEPEGLDVDVLAAARPEAAHD